MIYVGRYAVTLDAKNRTRIPAKLRAKLGADMVMCGGMNGCAYLMNESELEAKYAEIAKRTKYSDDERRDAIRVLGASSFSIEEDAQGRFVFPLSLKKMIQADKSIVFIGTIDCIEVWAEEVLDDKISVTAESVSHSIRILEETQDGI